MVTYRQFILQFFFCSLLLLLSVGFINYYEDPANQFHSSRLLEQKFANFMLKGKNIAVGCHVNERILQKIMLSQVPDKPAILVLGSSRAMPINRNLFPGESFYNASVSGAALEDDIAFYYLYHKRGWLPKTVIIGVDPWVLNKNNGQLLWKDLSVEYNEGVKLLTGSHHSSYLSQLLWKKNKYMQLLTWDYLTASIKNMNSSDHFLLPYDAEKYDNATYNLRLFDGTLVRSKDMEFTSAKKADLDGIDFAQKNPIYSLGNYSQLDPDYINLFENFINYLTENHVKIIFYLPPYEPKAYDGINKMKQYAMVNVAEDYFVSIAEKYNIKVVGSYNPSKLSLDANDFLDGMHMKVEGVNKVFGQINNKFYSDIRIDYWVA